MPFTGFYRANSRYTADIYKELSGKQVAVQSLKDIHLLQQKHIENLLAALGQMHEEIAVASERKRKSAIDSHNRKTGVRTVNFTE